VASLRARSNRFADAGPDFTGIVRNFSGARDGSGDPYFEFALTLSEPDRPYPYPLEVAHYIDLTQDNAPALVTLVVASWAFRFEIEAYLDDQRRIADVHKSGAMAELRMD
jgi:hypothetical protein